MEEERLYDVYALDEDIKICEEIKEMTLKACECGLSSGSEKCKWRKEAEAIEHLIEAYRKVEKENKELLEVKISASAHNRIMKLEEENKFISEEKWKADEAVIFLTKRLENSYKNSIPKSKIKEKIEYKKQKLNNLAYSRVYLNSSDRYKKTCLQAEIDFGEELLEEE